MSYTCLYPSSIPSADYMFNKTDDVDFVQQEDFDGLKEELHAVMIELGTLPKGAYADVKTRLDNIGGGGFIDRGDPAAVDFSVGDLTQDGAWHDLDLSSIVPANAVSVLLRCAIRDDAFSALFLRKNGNSNNVNTSTLSLQVINKTLNQDIVVFCDANRVIEYFASNTTWDIMDFTVAGWWF